VLRTLPPGFQILRSSSQNPSCEGAGFILPIPKNFQNSQKYANKTIQPRGHPKDYEVHVPAKFNSHFTHEPELGA
jgi:hypothetical protein